MSLSDFLVEQAVICSDILLEIQTICDKTGSSLEEILISHNYINPMDLYSKIALYKQLEFADLQLHPCNKKLINYGHRPFYKALSAIPWKIEGEHIIIATAKISEDLKQWAAVNFHNYKFAITSPFDVHHNINKLFVDTNNYEAIEILNHLNPQYSAKNLFKDVQTRIFVLLLGLILLLFVLFPEVSILTGFVVISFFYIATLFVKTLLFFIGILRCNNQKKTQDYIKIPDKELPIYTILIPLYKETKVLKKLTASIRNLDYPKSKLDVKLVVEEDDLQTIDAIKALKCERFFEIIQVPFSLPRTKPKACNYALQFAKGEYVTIYDAEDIPDPMQLKKVLQTFYNEADDVKCIQCKLNYFNREENLLSRLFAIEYEILFDAFLFGLEAVKIPIPLGGTSNHFKKTTLQELYGWDPYNVTEDADIGIRIAQKGWRCRIIDSTTLEESPIKIGPWIRQRSRWIKGHLQTYFVHMRSPFELYKKTGMVGFMGIQFCLGVPIFIFLLSPFMWILCALFIFDIIQVPQNMPLLFYKIMDISILMLIAGFLLQILQAVIAVQQNKWRGMFLAIIAFPFYWILHSVASFKALWQLIKKPHYWEKTNHGETSF